VELHLGDRRLDLRSRAMVIGAIGLLPDTGVDHYVDGRASALPGRGADAVELCLPAGIEPAVVRGAVSALVELGADPLGCVTSSPDLAAAAVASGASFVHDRCGLLDPRLAETLAATGVVAIVDVADDEVPDLRARATAAGIGENRLVVAAEASPGRSWSVVTGAGVLVMASLPSALHDVGEIVGLTVAAVTAGCRILCGPYPTPMRRAADLCFDLLEAR
jgi:hypothetical protein